MFAQGNGIISKCYIKQESVNMLSTFSGFAIKVKKEAFNYSEKIETFVYKLWLIGEQTGHKIQPPEAVQRMRHAVVEGTTDLLFGVHEWMREPNVR